MSLRTCEWILCVYFAYLAGATVGAHVSAGRRTRMLVSIGLILTSVLIVAQRGHSSYWPIVRDWIPGIYLLLAYWLPMGLVSHPYLRFERWLVASDRRWLGPGGWLSFTARTPRVLGELFELAYLFCYPLVPAGLACLYVGGEVDEVNRFWTAVLIAVLPCYGTLPWLPTRAPRSIEPVTPPSGSHSVVRALNLQVLSHASVHWNTFPSGHAAAAVATALAVGVRLPMAGVVLGMIAAGIIIGSVLGRYHYTADAISGIALGAAGFVLSRAI